MIDECNIVNNNKAKENKIKDKECEDNSDVDTLY